MVPFHVAISRALHRTSSALTTPLAGWLVGRYGARKVILPATAMFGVILLSNKAFSATLWQCSNNLLKSKGK